MRSYSPRGWMYPQHPPKDVELNSDSPQAKGLLIWTPFSRVYQVTHGTLKNYTHRTGNGTYFGSSSWAYDPIIGPYIYLTSASAGFDWGDETQVEGIDQLTVSAWVRKSDAWAQDMIWAKHTSGTDGCFYLSTTTSTNIRFAIINASSTRVDHDVTFAFATNTWYHVVGVYNGIDIRIYIDGIHYGTPSAQTGLIKNHTSTLRFGDYAGGLWDLEGDIAEPRIYDRALSAGEVWAMYDPATRWDLYKPINPTLWPVGAAVAYTLEADQGSYSYSGQTASPLAGRKVTAAQGSYSLSGQATALLRGFLVAAAQGSYTLTGQDAGLLIDRLIGAAQGSYTLTGQDADLLRGFLLEAVQGSYSLTGQDADLLRGFLLDAAQGSYSLSGQDVGLLIDRVIAAAQGTYTLTGQDAALLIARLLTAAQGSYALTGQDTDLLRGFLLTAAQGSYTLSGQDVNLLIARLIEATQGSYIITGQDAGIVADRIIAAVQGSYTLSGQDTDLLRGFLLTAAQGSYLLFGQDVILTYSPAVGYTIIAEQGSYTLTGQDAALEVDRILTAAQGSYSISGQDVGLMILGGIVPEWRIFSINSEDRQAALIGDARSYAINSDNRSFAIINEDRVLVVGLSDRKLAVN